MPLAPRPAALSRLLLLLAAGIATPVAADPKPVQRVAPPIVHETTPALGAYTDEVLFGDLWKRTELAPRDRSMVTIAALIAGGHTGQMTGHFNRGLDNGVLPAEIAAVITHLAFYAGWPRAISAVGVAREVFDRRGIAVAALAVDPGPPLPVDEAQEAARAAAVRARVGLVAPALAGYTNGVLFDDLWRRGDLKPRDRSLVTIAALIANGQVEQAGFHMNRGMENGLSQAELSEVITHLAFYAGWPRAISALPVAKTVFEARTAASAAPLEILRHGSQAPTMGAAANFTGRVQVDSRFQRTAPARVGGGIVSFEAGAHTAWHSHPLGQTLIVTAGCGLVLREGEEIKEIRPGDVVSIPPGARHWHGASATSAMTHVAIAESLNGRSVDWMEHVSAEQYAGGARPSGGC